MSAGIALEGLRLVNEYLPRAYADGTDLEARAQMMAAAAMGAVAFQKGLGAIHALSHPVGAVYNTHHGTTNAVVMPACLAFNDPRSRARSPLWRPIWACRRVRWVRGAGRRIERQFRLSVGPEGMGVDSQRIPELAAMAIEDPSAGGNPVPMTWKTRPRCFTRRCRPECKKGGLCARPLLS